MLKNFKVKTQREKDQRKTVFFFFSTKAEKEVLKKYKMKMNTIVVILK